MTLPAMVHSGLAVLLLSVLCVLAASASDFPTEKVPRCNYGDTECIKRSAEFILQNSKDGIPELHVPRLDPVDVKYIKLENPGIVSVDLIIKDAKMTGLSKSKVMGAKGFSLEFDPNEFNEMEVLVPQVSLTGPYEIDGKVFFIPIKGNGFTNFTFDNLNLKFKFRSKPMARNNQFFFRANDMDLSMSLTRLYVHFDNLFNGDKFLGDQANGLLNRRWEDLFREVKPKIERAFAMEITDRVNEAFADFPYSEYFLPGPIPKSKVDPEVLDEVSPEKAGDETEDEVQSAVAADDTVDDADDAPQVVQAAVKEAAKEEPKEEEAEKPKEEGKKEEDEKKEEKEAKE